MISASLADSDLHYPLALVFHWLPLAGLLPPLPYIPADYSFLKKLYFVFFY